MQRVEYVYNEPLKEVNTFYFTSSNHNIIAVNILNFQTSTGK